MATKTGSSYTTGTTTDSVEIPTANLGFSTTPSTNKLIPADCDNNRQPEIAIWTFCLPILQFLAVDRCRNHLANLLSSLTSSKIRNMALEFRRYLSEFQRCNNFRFGGHIDISGCRSLLYLLANIILHLCMHGLIPQICRWNFSCTFHSIRDISINGFGRHFHFRMSLIIGIDFLAILPRSTAVGSLLEF